MFPLVIIDDWIRSVTASGDQLQFTDYGNDEMKSEEKIANF